jgi:hypothetical protein
MEMVGRLFFPPFSIFIIAFLVGYPMHSGWHPIMRFLLAAAIIWCSGVLQGFG